MIPGDGVVKAQAFGAFADQAHSHPAGQLGKLALQHGLPAGIVVPPGQFQAFHGPTSPGACGAVPETCGASPAVPEASRAFRAASRFWQVIR